MTLDQPLKNLWEVVGAAGNPPKDQAATFAMISLLIMGVTAIAVPVVVAVVFVT